MFFHLLFIHLFRPFLKYKQNTTPLPSHVSPRKLLTHASSMISKLLRLYKRTHGLRQICNIVVYISHSACTVHLLNLPDKNAARDIIHGLKHLEEISESWLCARRTLAILQLVSKRWNIEVPEEAEKLFTRTEAKFGGLKDRDATPKLESHMPPPTPIQPLPPPATEPSRGHGTQQQNQQLSNGFNGPNGLPNSSLYPSNAPVASPMPATGVPNIDDAMNIPPQSAAGLGAQSGQHAYSRPQLQQPQPSQQAMWSQAPTTSAPPAMTSPTMLFGGIDSLIQDQEWWLRDSNQMFANWNGIDHDNVMPGHQGFGMGPNNMSYANPPYGINGMNGQGNLNMGFHG